MNEKDILRALYSDDRTQKLVDLFGWSNNIGFNPEVIKNLDLTPYDSYRLTMLVASNYEHAQDNSSMSFKMSAAAKLVLSELPSAKVFMVNEKLKFLLGLTKPASLKDCTLNLPFNDLFFDMDIKVNENIRIFGLWLEDARETVVSLRKTVNDFPEDTPRLKEYKDFYNNLPEHSVRITYCYFSDYDYAEEECFDKGLFCFESFIYDLDNMVPIDNAPSLFDLTKKEKKLMKYIRKLVSDYVSNLLLFLNEPRVKVYSKPDVENNSEKRLRKGKIPLPSLLITRIETGLAEYIERVYFTGQSHSKLGYAFWVRGHWMLFRSERYINMKGSKIWVAPYLKGEGIIPPQVFVMT